MITILIAEDNADAREIFAAVLLEAGYAVVEAKDGVDALACWSRESFQLILTDLRMPNMDGLQLARIVRGSPSNSEVPIILLTATPFLNKADGFDIFDAVLVKPCPIDNLLDTVDRLIPPH